MSKDRLTDRKKAAINTASKWRDKSDDIMQVWYDIATDKEEAASARTAAGNAFMDRILGRAPQGVEITGEDGGPIEGKFIVEFVGTDTEGV